MPHRPSPSSPSPRRGRPLRGLRGLVAAGGVVLLLGSAVQPAAAQPADTAAQSAAVAHAPSTTATAASTPRLPRVAAVRELDARIAEAGAYLSRGSDGVLRFDAAAAAADGASADVLDLGAVMNQMAGPASSGPHAQAKLSLPIWGNWCGPGHGGGTPIDVLDSICRTHDRCYGARGYFACSCDREIVKNIRANVHRMGSRESLVAAAVATYFTYCLCNPLK